MCARNGFIQAHGFGGPPVGRFRPVRGAIDEGDIGRYEGEPRKAVSAGIRGKELRDNKSQHPIPRHRSTVRQCRGAGWQRVVGTSRRR